MDTYEYLVNNELECLPHMDAVVENLKKVDKNGQFLASSARFLHAVDAETFGPWIQRLIEGAIDKDRERKYIGSLLEAIWGHDYRERREELEKSDDNFRRIYKRLFPLDTRPGLHGL